MSYADKVYCTNLANIIHYGSMETPPVRPHWPDGEPAPTKRIINVCNQYDLREEFPILTCRPVSITRAADEMCWIFQRKSNNIKDLNSHVWDQWADETGSVGKTYGYQAGKVYDFPEGRMDQVDRVLTLLNQKSLSRHIIINLWNPADYMNMHLAPCCCWLQFNIVDDRLDMVLYQRSLDMIAAGGWDVTAHSLLLMMFARDAGLNPGIFTHFVSNMHIYDRHIPIAQKILNDNVKNCMFTANGESYGRVEFENIYPAPKVGFKPDAPYKFYELKPEDFCFLTPYLHSDPLEKFEVAI